MQKRFLLLLALCAVFPYLYMNKVHSDEGKHFHIVGSSTMYPLMEDVIEYLLARHLTHLPLLESTGSVEGLRSLCVSRPATDTAYLIMASRKINKAEHQRCRDVGIRDVMEIPFGMGAVVFGRSVEADLLSVSQRQMFLALSAYVPVDGQWVENPYVRWSDIDEGLPDEEIRFIVPPHTSGTRDLLLSQVVAPFCEDDAFCALREDRAYIEGGENDRLIILGLHRNPQVVGVLGFNWLQRYRDDVLPVYIDGVVPSKESVLSETYPYVRPLYLYVRRSDVEKSPWLKEFLEVLSEPGVSGEGGLLERQGLVLKGDMLNQDFDEISRLFLLK